MKQVKKLFALLFVMAALCCTGMTAFAQTGADIASSPPTAYNESAEGESGEEPVIEQLIEPAVPENPEESPAQQQEVATEQPAKGSNTPYFVGAGIAVLVFVGVAVFCKIKGRN